MNNIWRSGEREYRANAEDRIAESKEFPVQAGDQFSISGKGNSSSFNLPGPSVRMDILELFRYKVIYPGGTFVRKSPALDAEKTGKVLDFGVIFEASKSLYLDGVNYAKLADGSGWVFERKNGIEILTLLEVIRVPPPRNSGRELGNGRNIGRDVSVAANKSFGSFASSVTSVTSSTLNALDRQVSRETMGSRRQGRDGSSILFDDGEVQGECDPDSISTRSFTQTRGRGYYPAPLSSASSVSSTGGGHRQVRTENRVWRDVRARCGNCCTFDEFQNLALATDVQIQQSSSRLGVESISALDGPARSARMMAAETSHHDQQVRCCIALIVSITRQCSADIAEQDGLEACLWVLVHMGSRVAHAMNLIVEAANVKFESVSKVRQAELLR
jgi:hypothetical protein